MFSNLIEVHNFKYNIYFKISSFIKVFMSLTRFLKFKASLYILTIFEKIMKLKLNSKEYTSDYT